MGDATWDSRAPHRSNPPPSPATPPSLLPFALGLLAGRSPLKVTDEQDGIILNRGYSYWPQAWVAPDRSIYVFVGVADSLPRFFRIQNGQVERLGSLLPYGGTSEGWQWDAEGHIHLLEGPRIRRVNPLTQADTVMADISPLLPQHHLWQMHVSDDGRTYTATAVLPIESGPYPKEGTVIFQQGVGDYKPARKPLDESHVTRDGRFVIILEGEDNRILDLDRQVEFTIADEDGAVGHADCGDGILIGEDNIHGACVLWDLRQPLTLANRRNLFQTWNMGHVSVRGGKCLLSSPTHLSLVALDGSGVTPFLEHGMVGEGYDYQVHGNLDPTGRVACYVTNSGTDRMDLWMAEIP